MVAEEQKKLKTICSIVRINLEEIESVGLLGFQRRSTPAVHFFLLLFRSRATSSTIIIKILKKYSHEVKLKV